MVKLLLQARANVDEGNCWGNNSVLAAASSGNLAILRTLIAARACLNEADISGRTPLTAAIAANHLDALQLLIEGRADVDDMYYGWSDIPLHAAAAAGQLEVVRLLLRAQADVNASRSPGSRSCIAFRVQVVILFCFSSDIQGLESRGIRA